MKKIILIVMGLLGLLVVSAVVLPFLIPVETYKQEIVTRVKEAPAATWVIAGPIRASLFPMIGVQMEQVSLSNPAGFTDKQMLMADAVQAKVTLGALLKGRLEINQLTLKKPRINLEVNKAGHKNWQFGNAAAPAPAPAAKADDDSAREALGGTLGAMARVSVAHLEISNGSVIYLDQPAGKHYQFDALDVGVSMPNPRAAMKLKAKGKASGETFQLSLNLDSPQLVMDGKPANVNFDLGSSLATSHFEGKANGESVSGPFSLSIPSLTKLSSFGGTPVPSRGEPLAVDVKGQMSCSASRCSIGKGIYMVNKAELRGDASVVFSGKVPQIEGSFTGDTLDLTPFMPQKSAAADKSGWISSAHAAEGKGWSTEKLQLDALRSVNADLKITLAHLIAERVKFSNLQMAAKLTGGLLNVTIPQMELYGGRGSARSSVDVRGAVPTISKQLSVSGIDAESFLTDAADFKRISGKAQMDISVNGRGQSEDEIVRSLDGNGSLKFTDGAIKGVNLAQVVRSVKGVVTGADTSGQQTDFSELGGPFTMQNGIAHNEDLAMKAPLIRMTGAGDVNLPQRRLRYRLVPEVVTTLKGQGGKEKEGLEVPVIVEGTFDHLTFRPDLESAVQDALKNPEKAKETVKNVKEQIKEGGKEIKSLLKGLRKKD